MRINDRHAKTLRKVQAYSARPHNQGGATMGEIEDLHESLGRTVDALVRNKFLETFNSRGTRGEVGFRSFSSVVLYRIAPKGAAYLMDVAFAQEARSVEHRMARRLVGVPPQAIRDALHVLSHHYRSKGVGMLGVPYVVLDVANEVVRLGA